MSSSDRARPLHWIEPECTGPATVENFGLILRAPRAMRGHMLGHPHGPRFGRLLLLSTGGAGEGLCWE